MAEDAWSRDALERKSLADFLTASLTRLSAASQDHERAGITVALDAEWGAGKTFFVKEWIKDLKSGGYPVVYFDAWSNDTGEEPSIALMAEIFEGLKPWKEQLPKSKSITKAAKDLASNSVRSLRAALLPAAGVVAKGLVKRATGVAMDEVLEAIHDGNAERSEAQESESAIGSALDKLFEKAIESHASRKRAVVEFKKSLAELIELLEKHANANLPFFVFIDELDRCRPSYALRLLEEVKHIFGIPGVVYIVSTNIGQLQNSVRAVYGLEFDGPGYLRRMFDKEYSLPSPNSESLLRLAGTSLVSIVKEGDLTGLPNKTQKNNEDPWTLIVRAMMPRDLRSQKQTIDLIAEVYPSIQSPVHLLWLYYLAALFRTKRDALDQIVSGKALKKDSREFVVTTIDQDQDIPYVSWSDHWGRNRRDEVAKLSDVIAEYMKLCVIPRREIDSLANYEGYTYPRALVLDVLEGQQGGKRPISSYPSLVRSAGYLTAS